MHSGDEKMPMNFVCCIAVNAPDLHCTQTLSWFIKNNGFNCLLNATKQQRVSTNSLMDYRVQDNVLSPVTFEEGASASLPRGLWRIIESFIGAGTQ